MIRRFAPLLALPLVLAACGGPVAPGAPDLLSLDAIAARTAVAETNPDRGAQVAGALTARAARLDARAEALRRTRLPRVETADLRRRAEAISDL